MAVQNQTRTENMPTTNTEMRIIRVVVLEKPSA
jgi:hypothetical protein